jgi:uncharacterized protein YndB with AHSA1/START domain
MNQGALVNKGLVAEASTTIAAPRGTVWNALVTPDTVKQYMFGATVISDWREGNPIVWKGEWQGKPFEDKGVILRLERERVLQYSHFSPLSGLPDAPDSYHTVTIELADAPPGTRVTLMQDNNSTEQARQHSEKNWQTMLDGLKKLLESGG